MRRQFHAAPGETTREKSIGAPACARGRKTLAFIERLGQFAAALFKQSSGHIEPVRRLWQSRKHLPEAQFAREQSRALSAIADVLFHSRPLIRRRFVAGIKDEQLLNIRATHDAI
jgi:hypothetical protein